MAREQASTWLRPSVVLPISALFLIALILFSPDTSTSFGGRLTTYSAEPSGMRGVYEVLRRLAYPVERRITPMSDALNPNAIYVVLAPAVPLSDTERNQLLAAVRRGAGLIFSWDRSLADSIGFASEPNFGLYRTLEQTQAAGGPAIVDLEQDNRIPLPISETATIIFRHHTNPTASRQHPQDSGQYKFERASFLWLPPLSPSIQSRDSIRSPSVILGRTFYNGKAVMVSDPEILRNVFAKDGRPIYALLRAVDWMNVTPTGTRTTPLPVVFDEYHQGFGTHANVPQAIARALTQTPLGRTTIQLGIAALIFLIAVGVRTLPPMAALGPVLRRSPLEHVSALANAYEQTKAKQLAADRLIRGLRRRHPLGIAPSQSHDTYLARLTTRLPLATDEIEMLRAMSQGESGREGTGEIAAAGKAVAKIETLTRL